MLRDLRVIGKHPYAVGVARQVYKRLKKNQWVRVDRGVAATKAKDSAEVGFNAIDGFTEEDIYAVGWSGEIWRYNGKRWSQVSSPTDQILERVVCAPDGKAYACGQSGVLLQGSGARWKAIDQQVTDEDFWGMAWFQDRLWVATLEGLFSLGPKGLQPEKMGDGAELTTTWLEANDGVLWSVGPEDLAYFDGKQWTEVRY